MNDTTLTTIEQVEVFLSAAHTVQFEFESQAAGYAWVQATLSRLGYLALGKRAKGIVRRYVLAVTGYSRAQGTRLIRQYRRSGCVQRRNVTRPRFKRTYTPKDVRLLAKTDELHGTLSGPATKKIFERAFSIFGEADYERLAAISVGHLYNPRLRGGRFCATAWAIANTARPTPRRTPARSRSARDASPSPTERQATCASTRCTRAI